MAEATEKVRKNQQALIELQKSKISKLKMLLADTEVRPTIMSRQSPVRLIHCSQQENDKSSVERNKSSITCHDQSRDHEQLTPSIESRYN